MTLCGVQGPCSTGLNAARALTAWEPTAGSDAAPGGRRRLEDSAALSQLGSEDRWSRPEGKAQGVLGGESEHATARGPSPAQGPAGVW